MASVKICEFCARNAMNHDHDDCAQKWGDRLKEKITTHSMVHPDKPLPPEIANLMNGNKFAAYQAYLKRKKEFAEVERHMSEIRGDIVYELTKILNEEGKRNRLNKKNRPLGWRKFRVNISFVVEVSQEPVY